MIMGRMILSCIILWILLWPYPSSPLLCLPASSNVWKETSGSFIVDSGNDREDVESCIDLDASDKVYRGSTILLLSCLTASDELEEELSESLMVEPSLEFMSLVLSLD
ncbi:hypothetical protein L6452_36238 [Arctium lappa]|uniref:Uncharacterized protein n=1 Tax=Arctium lappa TaxID=4217 RepID=A0ACB8YCV3_ARCLA|nr:hypothetical protein L6452_36238 [Arctium lappa]